MNLCQSAMNAVNNPDCKCFRTAQKRRSVCGGWWGRKKICRKGETERDWISATLWRACLDFSTPKNALSDSGSVALTPISAYTFTVPCATVMREWTMCLRARTTHSERKYAIVRECNPLTVFEHPLETPTCLNSHTCSLLAALLGGISEILCCRDVPVRCDDFMVNKPAQRKTPVHFPQKERKGYDSLLKFFLWLYLVLSAIQLSIFPGAICLILCQCFTAIRAAII